jgi:PilZ domain
MNSMRVHSSHHEARRAERLDVIIEAGLREHGNPRFEVKVIDLSLTGFRCETSFNMNIDGTVWLTIPGLSGLESRVVWKDKFRYGFVFLQPLYPAVFDHIIRQFRK